MYTVKQLQDKFINERFNGGSLYHQICIKLIYEGFTTKDWLCKTYKINPNKLKKGTEAEVKKLGLNLEELQAFVNSASNETRRRIEGRFKKYRVELNELREDIEKLPPRPSNEENMKLIRKYMNIR